VVVHKTSHTGYFPGSEKVSLMLIFNQKNKKVLGAQVAGRVGVDKRIDVIATAIAGGMTIEDLSELDLAYAPPFNSPNGPINMAAFTAVNHDTGFSPSILAQDLEQFAMEQQPIVIDVRDPISYGKANMKGTNNLSQDVLRENLDTIPKDHAILMISDDGQKGHVVLRMLKGMGFDHVFNLSGGYISLERYARAIGYQYLSVGTYPVVKKSVEDSKEEPTNEEKEVGPDTVSSEGPLVLDVRTPMEFERGAYPGAINVELDSLAEWAGSIEDKNREIIVYCASGARSSYGKRILNQLGFTNVENGGGLHTMLSRLQ
ncbi:MAG: rhodanese-like domain-containing protein, partial [Sphaerochaetaceae bacterium]